MRTWSDFINEPQNNTNPDLIAILDSSEHSQKLWQAVLEQAIKPAIQNGSFDEADGEEFAAIGQIMSRPGYLLSGPDASGEEGAVIGVLGKNLTSQNPRDWEIYGASIGQVFLDPQAKMVNMQGWYSVRAPNIQVGIEVGKISARLSNQIGSQVAQNNGYIFAGSHGQSVIPGDRTETILDDIRRHGWYRVHLRHKALPMVFVNTETSLNEHPYFYTWSAGALPDGTQPTSEMVKSAMLTYLRYYQKNFGGVNPDEDPRYAQMCEVVDKLDREGKLWISMQSFDVSVLPESVSPAHPWLAKAPRTHIEEIMPRFDHEIGPDAPIPNANAQKVALLAQLANNTPRNQTQVFSAAHRPPNPENPSLDM